MKTKENKRGMSPLELLVMSAIGIIIMGIVYEESMALTKNMSSDKETAATAPARDWTGYGKSLDISNTDTASGTER